MHRAVRYTSTTLLWLVTILAALTLGKAGYGKFADAAGWQYWFEKWGFAAWFATVIGIVELGGSLLLLVPRFAAWAAAALGAVMLGALHTVTMKETDLSVADPIINLALLAIVLVARWPPWPYGRDAR